MKRMAKTWIATRLGYNKEGKVCFEICCDPTEEPALRKMMEIFFNLVGEDEEELLVVPTELNTSNYFPLGGGEKPEIGDVVE